jgi:hypothetical protein
MGTYLNTRVVFGGTIKRSQMNRLAEAMQSDWGDWEDAHEELTDAISEGRAAVGFTGESSGGYAQEFVDLLDELGLSWRREADGNYEFDGEITVCDPERGERTFPATTDADEPTTTLANLRAAAKAGKTLQDVISQLAEAEWQPPALTIAPRKSRAKKEE